MTRKMAKVVTIDGISPIAGADAIEVAQIGGWSVVTKKNEFKVGDLAVYCEVDSFLPEGNPAWQFLVNKSSRNFSEKNVSDQVWNLSWAGLKPWPITNLD